MPRLTRTVLLLFILSLLILPTGDARAQSSGELTATLTAGAAASCTAGTTRLPDGSEVPVTTGHERCIGGSFSALVNVTIEATRDAGADVRTAACDATPPAGSVIPFTTRENTAAGRGRFGPATISVGTGLVVDDNTFSGTGPCTIRLTGAFHRVTTLAAGRLVIDVQVDTGNPARDFSHWYCARFAARAVPIEGGTLVNVEVEGRQPCRVEEVRDTDRTHGRSLDDNFETLHDHSH